MKAIKETVATLPITFVAVAMTLILFAPAAQAQTQEELQSQIDDLLATIAALQAQIGGTDTGPTASCSFTFTTAMAQGATGTEVMDLQTFLNKDPDTRVAVSGAGSPGMETQYYGPATAAAVSKFQAKYRADVLTPLGLANSTGYWGNSSIAKANEICAADSEEAEEGAPASDLTPEQQVAFAISQLSGEGSLQNYNRLSAPDDEIREGGSAQVFKADVEVENGDLLLARVDFLVSGDNEAPYDYFETVTLWIDGEEIRTQPVNTPEFWSQKDDFTALQAAGVNASNAGYSLAAGDELWGSRFPSIFMTLEEGEEYEVMIGFEAQDNVSDLPMDWYMFIDDEGIRALTADDYNVYEGDEGVTGITEFTYEEAGSDDELIIRTSPDDPDATVIPVEESTNSDWTEIFAFDLDTDDSENDMEIETAVVGMQFGGGETYSSVVHDVQLVIDGEVFDDVTVTGTTNATLTFDIDNDLEIDAGERVTAELQVKFLKQSGNYDNGDSVTATTTATGWEAEGADDVIPTGSATSDTHTLRTSGVTLAFDSSSETFVENDNSTTADNKGAFKIVFDVTAFEDDMYFEKTTDRSTTTSNQAANYILEDSSGAEVESAGTDSAALTSTADTESGHFVVREGTTETFTLSVDYDPATAGFYKLQLHAVNFKAGSAAAPDQTQTALPATSFETDPLSI